MTLSMRWQLPAAMMMLIAAAVSFVIAMLTPFVHITFEPAFPAWVPDLMGLHARLRTWLIELTDIHTGPQYILQIVQDLGRAGEWALAVLVGMFSVCFPVFKITTGLMLSISHRFPPGALREKMCGLLGGIGKWSMADVFIVGFLIVYFKAEAMHFHYEAGPGLYAYTLSALLSSAASQLLLSHQRALKRARCMEMVEHLFTRGRQLQGVPGGVDVREAAVFLREELT